MNLNYAIYHQSWLRSRFQKQSYANNDAEHYAGIEWKSISDNMKNIVSIVRITSSIQIRIKISFEI